MACRYGHLETMQVLLEGGANPLLLDGAGHSPLDLASTASAAHPLGQQLVNKQQLVALLKQHTAK